MIYITKADFADLADILALQKIAYQSEAELNNDYTIPPLMETIEQIEEAYRNLTILKAVEEASGKIIGAVRGMFKEGTVYIGRLIVQPDLQNRGIGRQLLSRIEEYYPGCRYELFTSTRSEKNLALYQKVGFREFKREQVTDNLEFIYMEKT